MLVTEIFVLWYNSTGASRGETDREEYPSSLCESCPHGIPQTQAW